MNLDLSTTQTTIPDNPSHARRDFLTPLPEPGHFLLVIDNTGLEKIKRCHVTGYNYLILGTEPMAKNAALTFGGAIHEGLETLLRGEPADIQDQRMQQYFTDNPAPPDEYRTINNALQVLKYYRERSNPLLHPDYEWEILSDSAGLLIERAFEVPLGTLTVDAPLGSYGHVHTVHVALSGRIDVIARTHGAVRVVDHKTSSIAGDQFTQSFQLSSQVLGYTYAASQLWPHLGPFGFCLNAICLKRPGVNQDLMSKGPRGGDAPLSFFRAFFPNTVEGYYTEANLLEWQNDTMSILEDFLHSFRRQHFPRNDRQCFDKYGRCPYHDACTSPPEIRAKILQSGEFKPVTWNPVAGR